MFLLVQQANGKIKLILSGVWEGPAEACLVQSPSSSSIINHIYITCLGLAKSEKKSRLEIFQPLWLNLIQLLFSGPLSLRITD